MRHLQFIPLEGNELTISNGMLIQRVRGGKSKTRADIVGSPFITNVTLVLKGIEYNQWVAFYDVLINNGQDMFTMDIMVDQWAVEAQKVKIVSDWTVTHMGYASYVNFEIEICRDLEELSRRKVLAEVLYVFGTEDEACKIFECLEQIGNHEFEYTDEDLQQARLIGNAYRIFKPDTPEQVIPELENIANNEFLDA